MALNINGTTGISGVDGSASAPALQGTDSNTGINFASDTVNINTGGTTRATVDSSGKVGIGTTSPSGVLHLHKADSGTIDGLMITNTSTTNNGLTVGVNSNEQPFFWNGSNTDMLFATNNTERMRIKSNGNTDLQSAETAQGTAVLHLLKNSANGSVQSDMIAFDVGGAGRGKIVAASSGSGTPSFSTYSDRRLKTNIKDYISGYDKIKSIKVRSYDEVSNDDTKAVIGDTPATGVIGYIADEFQEVFPEGVRGTKDQVDSDGKPIYQSISDGLLTPHLVQALQSAMAKIEVLETKVAALEAG